MSESQTKDVFAEFPLELAVEMKVDAIQSGATIKEWLQDAVREKLKRRREVPTEAG